MSSDSLRSPGSARARSPSARAPGRCPPCDRGWRRPRGSPRRQPPGECRARSAPRSARRCTPASPRSPDRRRPAAALPRRSSRAAAAVPAGEDRQADHESPVAAVAITNGRRAPDPGGQGLLATCRRGVWTGFCRHFPVSRESGPTESAEGRDHLAGEESRALGAGMAPEADDEARYPPPHALAQP